MSPAREPRVRLTKELMMVAKKTDKNAKAKNTEAVAQQNPQGTDDVDTGPKYDTWEWQVVTRSGIEGVDASPGGPEAAITEATNQGYRHTGEQPWVTGPEDHADGSSQVFTWHVPVEKVKHAPAEQPGNVPEPAPLKSDLSDEK